MRPLSSKVLPASSQDVRCWDVQCWTSQQLTSKSYGFTVWPPCGNSYGAPVPVEPRNNLRPSAKVISLPFALFEPSLDWYPSTTIFVPGGREFFVKPRRNKTFGVPASK